ncbi:hypothetical protein TRVA0_031S00562 [Trichomonascus vanleenenianus]|uniref:Hgh1p n=1 Tax=Trichomonascus vanleenenianus TaxID=2268995 RepID=UPI003ECA5F6D
MSTELMELVGFLHHDQAQIRQIALENLVGFSQGSQTFIFKGEDMRPVKDIKAMINEKSARAVGHALKILVNLCDDRAVLDLLASDEVFVKEVANRITDLSEINADLFSILLANLAKNDQVTVVMKAKRVKPRLPEEGDKNRPMPIVKDEDVFKSGNLIDCLMDCFVKGSDRSLNKYADFSYLSYFFMDVSRFNDGRGYFITEQAYDGVVPITKLLVFTAHESKIRREGVASTIKNSLFDVTSHENFVFDEKVDILPYLLKPLIAGTDKIDDEEMLELPEELQFMPEDKKREPVHDILTVLVECLLLLCSTRPVRDYFREKQVYPVIRELHQNVEDDLVRDPCERLVNMIMRDEADEKPKIVEEEDDEDGEIIEVL